MRPILVLTASLAILAACSSPTRVNDPRAKALLAMEGPVHYGERHAARSLAEQCDRYVYDADLARDMNALRSDSRDALTTMSGAIGLEGNVKFRSLVARYGQDASACDILDGETAARTPFSVMVVRTG